MSAYDPRYRGDPAVERCLGCDVERYHHEVAKDDAGRLYLKCASGEPSCLPTRGEIRERARELREEFEREQEELRKKWESLKAAASTTPSTG